MPKVVVLGTYWNEIEWVDRSLEQLARISPDFAVLCDGCFDGRHENSSDDGTTDRLKEFCEKHNYLFCRAKRNSRIVSVLLLLKFGLSKKFSFSYIYWVVRHAIRTNKYRLNQAVTFCSMLDAACRRVGRDMWFMTYDADQFYSDELVGNLRRIIAEADSSGEYLLSAKELTFNHGFDSFSDAYEKRTWNNMPHKLTEHTVILPTRDIKHSALFSLKYYRDKFKFRKVGVYYHYKFRLNKSREAASYQLGDRKAPGAERTVDGAEFIGRHPKVIESGRV